MNRFFEKVSFKQFKKDYYKYLMEDGNETDILFDEVLRELYDSIKLPKRGTKKSAGYDFASTVEFVLQPNEKIIVPTGIKASMLDNELLSLHVRSSVGLKYNVQLPNVTGIIDSDYYNNEGNEGHIMLAFINYGNKPWGVGIGDRVAQGIFSQYLIVDDDEPINESRKNGIGSTGRKAV